MQDYPLLEQYLQSGIGDLSDLEFKTAVAEGGKWVGLVNPGWYWVGAKLNYLYSSVSEVSSSIAAGYDSVSIPSASGTPMLFWAPVTINSTGDTTRNYISLSQTYRPMQTLTWSTSGEVAWATLPQNIKLLGVRNAKGQEYGKVAGLRDLVDKFYFYVDNGIIFLKEQTTSPDAFIDTWTTNQAGSALLLVSELCQATSSTQVYTKHRYPENVVVIHGYQSCSGSASENLITHTLSGVVVGDLIRLDYNVPYTYVVIDSATIGTYATSGDSITVKYELASPGTQHLVSTNYAAPLQLNPLFGGVRVGYLLANSASSTVWNINDAYIVLSTDIKTKSVPEWKEPFRVLAISQDRKGRRVPYTPITWSIPASVFVLNYDVVANNTTDGRGECHLLCLPGVDCAATLTFTAIPSTISDQEYGDTLTITTQVASSLINADNYKSGNIYLYLNAGKTATGARKMLGQCTYLDNIPWISTDSVMVDQKVKFLTKNGRIYQTSNQTNSQIQSIAINVSNSNQGLGAIQWNYYPPLAGDLVFASRQYENRKINSKPLTIPGGTNV